MTLLYPATKKWMRHYDKLAAWANQFYGLMDDGKVTVKNLTDEQRAKMVEVFQNQVAFVPADPDAVSAFVQHTAFGKKLADDMCLTMLPADHTVYRIWRASLDEELDWVFATLPSGELGIIAVTPFDRLPSLSSAVVHTWKHDEDGKEFRRDWNYDTFLDLEETRIWVEAHDEWNERMDETERRKQHRKLEVLPDELVGDVDSIEGVRKWLESHDGRANAIYRVQELARQDLEQAKRRARSVGVETSLFDDYFGSNPMLAEENKLLTDALGLSFEENERLRQRLEEKERV